MPSHSFAKLPKLHPSCQPVITLDPPGGYPGPGPNREDFPLLIPNELDTAAWSVAIPFRF